MTIKTSQIQRVTLFLKPDIVMQAKAQALVEELSLTSIIERALIDYLPKETIIKKLQV